jgi:hypothetical protein
VATARLFAVAGSTTYRAWQEVALPDPELQKKQAEIHKWTTGRVLHVFQFLQGLPSDSATHLIHHAIFTDAPQYTPKK